MPLEGKFDVRKFKRECEEFKNKHERSIPVIYYTAGRGETLESLFDEFVVYHINRQSQAVKKMYYEVNSDLKDEPDLEGKKVKLWSFWLHDNKKIPADLKKALDDYKSFIVGSDKINLSGEDFKVLTLENKIPKR